MYHGVLLDYCSISDLLSFHCNNFTEYFILLCMTEFCIIELSGGHCQEKTSIWISNADGHKWPQSSVILYSTSVRTKRASGVGAVVICICLFVLKMHVTDEQVHLEVSPGNSNILLKAVCSRPAMAPGYNPV